MDREERYNINHEGEIAVGLPAVPIDRKVLIQALFSQNGWVYEIIQEFDDAHLKAKVSHAVLEREYVFHLFHGNIRKEDPNRNREEKKIQLSGKDPRSTLPEMTIILGFYVFQANDPIQQAIIGAWPVEPNKNYPDNPSLRINARKDLLPAKVNGLHFGRGIATFRPEFIFSYLDNYNFFHQEIVEITGATPAENPVEADIPREKGGNNILLYGVPGSGKSHTVQTEYCNEDSKMVRVVFHPDYTYTDFVGQILPISTEEGIRYSFVPGPFTRILKKAWKDPSNKYYLIIEELNRGNAPAIFGEVFLLLDRDADGKSKYKISNSDIANEVYEAFSHLVELPSNFCIVATMNTSDQNVFTLDTAFQRRWTMRMIENQIDRAEHASHPILDSVITWQQFAERVNDLIMENNVGMASSEDKRLGAYFIEPRDIQFDDRETDQDEAKRNAARQNNSRFPEKILKYLWDDAFKFTRAKLFSDRYRTLEDIVKEFKGSHGNERFKIFTRNVFPQLQLNN